MGIKHLGILILVLIVLIGIFSCASTSDDPDNEIQDAALVDSDEVNEASDTASINFQNSGEIREQPFDPGNEIPDQFQLLSIPMAAIRAEEARNTVMDFNGPSYFPEDWNNAEALFNQAQNETKKDTVREVEDSVTRYNTAAEAYEAMMDGTIGQYSEELKNNIMALRLEALNKGAENIAPLYLMEIERAGLDALALFEMKDYDSARDAGNLVQDMYRALIVGLEASKLREEALVAGAENAVPQYVLEIENAALEVLALFEAKEYDEALAAGLQIQEMYRTLALVTAAAEEHQKALDHKANVAVKQEFDAAYAVFNQGEASFREKNFEQADKFYIQSKDMFSRAIDSTLQKRMISEEVLREANRIIISSYELARRASLLLAGAAGQNIPLIMEFLPMVSMVSFAQAIVSDIFVNVPNNRYINESIRLINQAQFSFDNGDYDASIQHSEEAVRNALLSDDWVHLQIKIKETDDAIAEARSRLEWASSPAVDAGRRYPLELDQAETAFNESLNLRNAESWDPAITAAGRVMNALAFMTEEDIVAAIDPNSSPAQPTAPTGSDTSQPTAAGSDTSQETPEAAQPGTLTGSDTSQPGTPAGSISSLPASTATIPQQTDISRSASLPAQYVVRLGDCLWSIAAQYWAYNDPSQWRHIYNANRNKMPQPDNPNLIYPGMILDIPSIRGESREGIWDSSLDYISPYQSQSTAALSPSTPLPALYRVRLGDCLWAISAQPWAYNDPYQWKLIYSMNREIMPQPDNPNLIHPGMVLVIPSTKGQVREGMWNENNYVPMRR